MINLETIAKKLDDVLNGIDTDIPVGLINPVTDNAFFKVFSEGLYLSTVADYNAGKNFFPVIVGAYGGENNPVEGLGEQDRNVLMQILFPVRFKEDFYKLEDYLDTIFVGRLLTFGEQKAVCNLSPAQFNELQDFSFNEFNHWVETTYKQPLDRTETYMAMNITLYLSTAKNVGGTDGFVYGNSYTTTIKTYDDDEFTNPLTDSTPVFVQETNTGNISPASQHILGEDYARGMPQTSAYSRQITLYVKDNSFYQNIISKYQSRTYQTMVVEINESYGLSTPLTDRKLYYVSDIIINANKGELMTITLTLADYLEDAPSEE